ncbi:MAG: DUF927 domain-containing protein [Rhizobacter sp.]|nr:DUF927 domain-containing protein [Rhizobacter sp.]
MSKEWKQRRRDALNKLKERGIRPSKKGLIATIKGQEQVIVAPFDVDGAVVNEDGNADGAAISAMGPDGKRRIRHVPLESLQEPKRLASHLAAIGIDPPIEAAHLQAIRTYIHTLSRLKRLRLFHREGIHRVEHDGRTLSIAAIGGAVMAPKRVPIEGLAPSQTIYKVGGTFEEWKEGIKPILAGNPLVIFGAAISFVSACSAVLDLPSLSILFVGRSSLGKTSAGRLIQSTYKSPEELRRWAGTGNGIEGLAAQHCDTMLVLDELGTAEQGHLGATIYRLSGGEGKARADSNGNVRASATIRCGIFATGEITKAERGRSTGESMRDGLEARLVTIPVKEQHGIFSILPPGFEDGGDLSNHLRAVLRANYGHAGPAFVRALIEEQELIVQRAPAKAQRYQAQIIQRTNCKPLSPLEGRVLEGFVTAALAGKLAVRFGILPVSGSDVMQAISHVFGLWLMYWREGADSQKSKALLKVRGWFQQHAVSDFVPLAEWDTSTRKGRPGYVLVHRKEGPLYLVHLDVLRDEICDGLDLEEVLSTLQATGLLATHGKGRQWLQRMPGQPKEVKGSRMKFYAIRRDILFDE